MIITIASGKGGTGKTTLAVNLVEYLSKYVETNKKISLLDCDVEAPNDKLFLHNLKYDEYDVLEPKPVWNKDNCKNCGKCKDACRYNAIARLPNKTLIFRELCHSCGACNFICPNDAITEEDYPLGKIYKNSDRKFTFIYGELNIGEIASPTVVRRVKKHIIPDAINIIDAPPGTGCSVVAALDDTDFSVLVTEPTPFGLHDLKLAAQLVVKIGIPFGVVVNRSDGNDNIIKEFLDEHNIPLLGKIPFDRKYAEAYSKGKVLVDEFSDIKDSIKNIYENIISFSKGNQVIKTFDLVVGHSKGKNVEQYIEQNRNKEMPDETKEVMIISGKGGTGKTTISAAFSQLAGKENSISVFEDCDVDAADLHLLLKPDVMQIENFSGGISAKINPIECSGCGFCAKICRFNAIDLMPDNKYKINKLKCEGCGFCILACPNNAVNEIKEINGEEYISDTLFGPMVHAKLGIAEENSGKLVSSVKTKALDLAEKLNRSLIIGDGPPGAGCPVIASVTGINLAVIITEPTVSGKHDMERVLKLAKHFDVPSKIIINKADLNTDVVEEIKGLALSYNSQVIAEIPFDRNINDALVKGQTIIEYGKGEACIKIVQAWNEVKKLMFEI